MLVLACQCGLQATPHEPQPEGQAAEKKNLPYAAQIDVFVTLRTKPEPQVSELLFDTHPLACERTDHHRNQREEQNVYAPPLAFWFKPAHRGGNVEPCSQP